MRAHLDSRVIPDQTPVRAFLADLTAKSTSALLASETLATIDPSNGLISSNKLSDDLNSPEM